MPRVAVPGFVGPSNVLQSRTLDGERTINFLQQAAAPGTGRSADGLISRPGLTPFAAFSDSPIRGIFEINGRVFVAGGTSFAEMHSTGTFGTVYTIANDGNPVSMCSNGSAGNQVFVVAGGLGYIFNLNTNVLTQITDPDFPANAVSGEFMDGYFLVWQANTRRFQWSALEDGTSWDGLDVAERSIASDNINGFIRNHRELWILGNRTTEVWYDVGDATTPFAPIQGVFVEHGVLASFSVARIDNTLMWLGLDVDGTCVVWKADGYTPRRVSTTAVERALQLESTPTDAYAWVTQIDGHLFYVLVLPRATTSWVYDISRDRWAEWAHWDSTACEWVAFRGSCHAFAFSKHLVGDRSSGVIYELTPSVYTDRLVA